MVIQDLSTECFQFGIANGTQEVDLSAIAIPNWPIFVLFVSLSSLFVTLNLVIYVLIWDQHNIHQWIQMCYLISLLLFNTVFLPALVIAPDISEIEEVNWSCWILSLLNQFFFILSKTWLLILSFDILRTLWKFEPIPSPKKANKTFRYYIVLSVLVPAIISTTGIILNVLHRQRFEHTSNDKELFVTFPDYGYRHCRIPTWDIWEYFVFTNCALHIILFLLILFVIIQHLCEVDEIIQLHAVQPSRRNRESIMLFLRLIIIVGVSWCYIAVQDMLGAGSINTPQGIGWQIFRAIFFLQGVFVSLIHVGNRKTVELLARKYPVFSKFLLRVQNLTLCRDQDKRLSVSTLTSNV